MNVGRGNPLVYQAVRSRETAAHPCAETAVFPLPRQHRTPVVFVYAQDVTILPPGNPEG